MGSLNSKASSSTKKTIRNTRTLISTKSSSEVKSTMATFKPLILVFGALLVLAKGKGVVALDDTEELFPGSLEGLKGFEGRQFSSLVGSAPWLQGAGHLLRLFGEARQGRQHSVVGTILTTVLQLLGFEQNQIGSRALDMVIYVTELFANLILGQQDSLARELEEGRALEQGSGIFPGLRAMVARAEVRAGEVRTKLLDPELTEQMVENLKNKTGDSTSCVQLFLCKISPLVWGVQDSSRVSLEKLGSEASLASTSREWLDLTMASLPSIDQLTKQSGACEKQHPACPLFTFGGVEGNSLVGGAEME